MEYDTSVEMDEFHKIQMEKFARWNNTSAEMDTLHKIQTEKSSHFKLRRRLELIEISVFRKLGMNSEEKKSHTVDWSMTSNTNCRIGISSRHLNNSAYEAIECERQRLQNQETCLSQEVLRRDFLHQQRVVYMLKQLDDASEQSQEETKSLSEKTTMCGEKWTNRVCFQSL